MRDPKKKLYVEYNKNVFTLSISEFAKLCGTTKDALRHYYEIGLLSPAKNPENGYKYYSPSQVASYYYIQSLKATGISLAEIRELMQNPGEKDIEDVIATSVKDIHEQIKDLKAKANSLDTSLLFFSHYKDCKNGVPKLHTWPKLYVCYTPIMGVEKRKHVADLGINIYSHITHMNTQIKETPFPIGGTISYENLEKKLYDYDKLFSMSMYKYTKAGTSFPSTKVVECYHSGHGDDIEKSYKKILDFIKRNKLKPLSDLHIISLINMRDSKLNHNYFKYLFIAVE